MSSPGPGPVDVSASSSRRAATAERTLALPVKPRSHLGPLWRVVRRHSLGALGAVCILGIAVVAAFAPQLAPHDPAALNSAHPFESPNATFWFGTNRLGRDLLSRMIFGARVTLSVGFLAVVIATAAGAVIGLVAGALKGRVDRIFMTVNDALIAIPFLIFAMVMIAIEPIRLGDNLQERVLNVSVAIAIGSVAYVARVVRAATLAVGAAQYIEAARAFTSRSKVHSSGGRRDLPLGYFASSSGKRKVSQNPKFPQCNL